MKNILIIVLVCIGLLLGATWWSKNLQQKDPEIVSLNGMHWHPELEIYVKGEKVEIPTNIGVGTQYAGMSGYDTGMQMTAVHTHDATGVIHFEFPKGAVYKKDLTLGQFFKMWNKDFHSFGNNVSMTVNGKENTELDQYVMQDKDKIILRYE